MKRLRFKITVISSFFYVMRNIRKARRYIASDKYSEEERFELACGFMDCMRRKSRTKTVATGRENLPAEGGYILYSNHQGKYDALGILLNHNGPCSVLWERKAADRFLAREVCGLLGGQTIELTDIRDSIRAIQSIAKEVANGRRYLIFPEGGYKDNKNALQEFKTGCFKASLDSKSPIIPVAIYDSYRAMDTNTFERVTTEVHYLEPIYFEEYGKLSKAEIASLVKEKIQNKLCEIKAEKSVQKKK